MSLLHYPEIHEYSLPEKNLLVISCIDLRLTDNLLFFLHFDNLHNRFDHFAAAGTSLCACAEGKYRKLFTKDALETFDFAAWKKTMDEHLAVAVALHDIHDVYIVEHMDCGAYKQFLQHDGPVTPEIELALHKKFSRYLMKEIHSKEYTDGKGKKYQLNVHCFIIDLRGNVRLLHTTTRPKEDDKD